MKVAQAVESRSAKTLALNGAAADLTITAPR